MIFANNMIIKNFLSLNMMFIILTIFILEIGPLKSYNMVDTCKMFKSKIKFS